MNSRVGVLVIDNLAVESLRREVYRALGNLFPCDVHVLAPTGWRETREAIACEPEEGDAIQLHRSRILFGFRHQRVVYLDLARVIRAVKPDFILAVAQPESYAGAQVCIDRRLYAQRAGLGLFSSRNIDYPRVGFQYRFKMTHRLCDTVTRKLRPEICFYRPRAAGELLAAYAKRVAYVPHVVDCSLFRRTMRENGDRDKRTIVVGYVGRLAMEKGVYTLLEAMRHLPPQIKLVMVGAGPEERRLRELITAYGLAGRIEVRGPVPYRDVPATLNRMDVLVLPSHETKYWKELFGRILIEAMACEVPVVASRSGGIPEVIGDAGMLVEPGNGRTLAAVLESLSADFSARCTLGRNGRDRALRYYDVPVVAGILGKAIMDTVESHAPGGIRA
jgi:glycosyltransferase involved in cell wall biosynthesis